jgi:hypothetical protein
MEAVAGGGEVILPLESLIWGEQRASEEGQGRPLGVYPAWHRELCHLGRQVCVPARGSAPPLPQPPRPPPSWTLPVPPAAKIVPSPRWPHSSALGSVQTFKPGARLGILADSGAVLTPEVVPGGEKCGQEDALPHLGTVCQAGQMPNGTGWLCVLVPSGCYQNYCSAGARLGDDHKIIEQ